MHLGRAVIATDSTGVADYIENGVTGLTVKMVSPRELARAIEQLWKDNELRDRLARNGRRFAEAHCSEESIAAHFCDWLTSRQSMTVKQCNSGSK
jgi:glycosyltransferase involved in cell wall biosynthesis